MGDGSPNKYDSKGKGRAVNDGDVLALDLDSAEEGSGNANGGAFMQMQLVEQQVSSVTFHNLNNNSMFVLGHLYSATVHRHRVD